ncbi:MAG: hypothetical protein ABJZ55_16940 [Fuerstiella sp.]
MAGRIDPATKLLTDLKTAADSSTTKDLFAAVESALQSKLSLVVEQAAILVRERELNVDVRLLLDAYQRLLVLPEDGHQSIEDKNCRAKLPLVESLHALQYDDPDFYSTGLQYVQWEPAWPENQETACNLRGAHAFALVSSQLASPHETLMKLIDLLFDKTVSARIHAAAAIGQLGHPGSAAVMKIAILQDSNSPDVVEECFRSLLRNDVNSLDFVASYLESDRLCIEAAASLTEFGSAEGVAFVTAKAQQAGGDFQEALFVTLGVSRHADALDFLIRNIRHQGGTAQYAIKALASKRFYPDVVRRVKSAVSAADDEFLWDVFRKVFGDDTGSD